tara:strand:+ start:611 stop:820 length:210 start_codon:yes stop_codon:yes gene_type:complete
MVELHLTLMNGDKLFIRDDRFVIHEETRNQEIKHLGDMDKPKTFKAAAVNGLSVMESMDEVCEMIGRQT